MISVETARKISLDYMVQFRVEIGKRVQEYVDTEVSCKILEEAQAGFRHCIVRPYVHDNFKTANEIRLFDRVLTEVLETNGYSIGEHSITKNILEIGW